MDELEEQRKVILEKNFKYIHDETDTEASSTLYGRLLSELSHLAYEHAVKNNIDCETFEDNFYTEDIAFLDQLKMALTEISYSPDNPTKKDFEQSYNFWEHETNPHYIIQQKKCPTIFKDELEYAVKLYLDLPYRSEAIDRILVDTLIASEMYAYGSEMINPLELSGFPSRSPLKQEHPLKTYLKAQSIDAIFFIGISGLAIFAGYKDWISSSWAFWIALGSILIFSVLFIRSLFHLPAYWKNIQSTKTKVIQLLQDMFAIYQEFNSSGAISINHLKRKIDNADDNGVVWPSTLYVMLDDISSRSNVL